MNIVTNSIYNVIGAFFFALYGLRKDPTTKAGGAKYEDKISTSQSSNSSKLIELQPFCAKKTRFLPRHNFAYAVLFPRKRIDFFDGFSFFLLRDSVEHFANVATLKNASNRNSIGALKPEIRMGSKNFLFQF